MNPLASIAQTYFDGLAARDLSRMPWSEDVVLRTPLRPAPLMGRAAVLEFFAGIMPGLSGIRLSHCYFSADGGTVVAEAVVGPLQVMDKFVVHKGEVIHQHNFFDPRPALEARAPGAITAQERALLVEHLEQSRDDFAHTVRAATDAQWNAPRDGGWSAAQCAEHVVLSEDALLALVRDTMLGAAPDAGLEAQTAGKDGLVVKAMRDRSQKGKTWDFLEPQGRWTSREHTLDAFLARRAATLDFVRACPAALHHHGAPLAPLGMLDAYQWLLLMAAHTGRHAAQLRDALA